MAYLGVRVGHGHRSRCIEILQAELEELKKLLNTPEVEYFDSAVPLEAAHQVSRWSAAHDAGKNPEDWFWLIGFLAGKALASAKAGNPEKAKHHCISTAAVLRNWHAQIRSGESAMRPGIEPPSKFEECSECARKPGSPMLCPDCLRRRDEHERALSTKL